MKNKNNKGSTEELFISIQGGPTQKVEAILKGWHFKNLAEFLITAIDVFEIAIHADGKIQIPDSKNNRIYIYSIDRS